MFVPYSQFSSLIGVLEKILMFLKLHDILEKLHSKCYPWFLPQKHDYNRDDLRLFLDIMKTLFGFYQSISCWDNCRNNLGVVLTVATASWDTVMFVILHATLFDIYTPFYWCLTLCNENMIFDPQNKKMTPPPPSKPPSIGA